MRRILSVALMLTAVGALAVAPAQAAKRGAKQKTTTIMAASECTGMICSPGSCPLQAKTAVATKSTTKAHAAKAATCPVSDPSACPSACPRVGATAVAAIATR